MHSPITRRLLRLSTSLLLTACAGGAADHDASGASGLDDTDTDTGEPTETDADEGGDDEFPDGAADPGRVTLRRLNRVEYGNTMRDLFWGLDLDVGASLPFENAALGYDNIGDVLSVTPLLFDLYERATEQVLTAAMFDPQHADVRARLIPCDLAGEDPDGCIDAVVRAFARRAWRRPPDDAEIAGVLERVPAAMAAGSTREEGVMLALQQVLMSPHFVFRVELDPDPSSPDPHALDDHELATRLSYFMWSTMPDDALMAAADAGLLQDPQELERQVDRMLADPRAIALLDNFAGQWLDLRRLATLTKEASMFPDFDAELLTAMRAEAEHAVIGLFTGERSLLELMTSDQGMVNDRLARHYGLPEPGTDALVPVSLAGVPRRGLMTQAGMMAVLADAERTSATRRGKWILSQLFCTPPPPPPPDVDNNLATPGPGETTRDVLEQLREDPRCATCHGMMDPIGLAFENYDAIGRWRDEENGVPIDASFDLAGTHYANAYAWLGQFDQDSAQYERCASTQLLTYAIGRRIAEDDGPHVDALAEVSAAAAAHMPELLVGVAQSVPFRFRRGEPE